MKKKEIQEKLGTLDSIFEEHRYNALRIALDEEWNRSEVAKEEPDYRDRAINRCLEAKVPFTSETNTLTSIASRVLTVTNPLNGNVMEFTSGGGSMSSYTLTFKDSQTGDLVQISLPYDAIRVSPKETEQ